MLHLARTNLGGRLVGWMFENLSFLIPGKRLFETKTLLAFHHPKPDYPLHILIVPKKAIANLVGLNLAEDLFRIGFLEDLIDCVEALVEKFGLGSCGYRLIVNGGMYQDVPQLHFHLVSEHESCRTDEQVND